MANANQPSVEGVHRLVLPSQHVDQVEHRQVTVKDCVTLEAVGHLGIGMVVRLITGVKKPQELVHERIISDVQRRWRRLAAFCAPLSLAGVPYAECTVAGQTTTLLRLDPTNGAARKLAALPIGSKGIGQSGGAPVYAQHAAAANQDGD
ncbi:hypothetical protein SALBM311S_10126 [Streptomyces alboniger]